MNNKSKKDAIAKAAGIDPKSLKAMICIGIDGNTVASTVYGHPLSFAHLIFNLIIDDEDIQQAMPIVSRLLDEHVKIKQVPSFNSDITGEA